MKDAVMRWCD